MIGQTLLLNKINKYSFDTFPQSVIFEGEYGCGKHLLIDYITDRLKISSSDISLEISNDLILNLYTIPTPMLYIIDIDKASQSKKINILQNAILKFVEEPPQLAKVVIVCEYNTQLLDTIKNRCQLFTFEKYHKEQLKQFSTENNIELLPDYLYDIYNTPGKLLLLKNSSDEIHDIEKLIDNMIENIHRATVPNVLSIVNKIDFGNGGYNLNILLQLMRYKLIQKMNTTQNFGLLKKYYMHTAEIDNKIKLLNVNKKLLFENYLMNLKSETI